MDNQTIQLRPLKDFALTDKILDPNSAVSAIESAVETSVSALQLAEQASNDTSSTAEVLSKIQQTQNTIKEISFNPDNFTDIEYLADSLKDIIAALGGKIENNAVSEFSFNVTQEDIDNDAARVIFTANPFMAWGDLDKENLNITVTKAE